MERVCQKLEEKVDERDNKIKELLEKMALSGNQTTSEVKEISHSLHKIKE